MSALNSHAPWRDFLYRALILGVSLIALAGCSKPGAGKVATQVAAKVNSQEISVHEINNVLGRMPAVPPDRSEEVKRAILDRLINQQLAVQQALEKKLDRTPEVLLALEAARREVLASAYSSTVTASVPKPTDAELQAYYSGHPESYGQRRVYRVQEILAPEGKVPAGELRSMIAAKKQMSDIAQYLKKADVKFSVDSAVRSTDQTPPEIVAEVAKLKDGEIGIIETTQVFAIVQILESKDAPVAFDAAKAQIEQRIMAQRNGEAIKQDIEKLRKSSKIEYEGEFANVAGTKEIVPETAAKPTTAKPSDPLDKGISGLK